MTNLNPAALGPLYEACKAMYPYLADVVHRGQIPGHDTSHYGDARAVDAARSALTLAETPSPVGDVKFSTTDAALARAATVKGAGQ